MIGNNLEFYKWFIGWYKPISKDMNIAISLPADIGFNNTFKDANYIVLDVFEKIKQNIDAKPFLSEIIKKADEYGVVIYLEPKPRYSRFLENADKIKKITKEYLINYYKNFGFELMVDKNIYIYETTIMRRNPLEKKIMGGIIKSVVGGLVAHHTINSKHFKYEIGGL